MANVIQCPGCQQQYSLQPSLAGKQVQCNQCGQAFLMPESAVPDMPQAGGTAQQRPEPTPLERGASFMGFMLLAIIALAFAKQLTRTGQVGPISLAIYAVLTLMAVGLMVPRFWHAPLKGLLFAGKAIVIVVIFIGANNILGLDNNRPRPKRNFTTPNGLADQELPISLHAKPTAEPAPCGQPVTFWNVRVNGDSLSSTSFTAEYRVDQPETLDATRYLWLVYNDFYTVEIPVTLDSSGHRGKLQGSNLAVKASMVSSLLENGWQSHLLEVRGFTDKRIVSNTVTVELADAPFE